MSSSRILEDFNSEFQICTLAGHPRRVLSTNMHFQEKDARANSYEERGRRRLPKNLHHGGNEFADIFATSSLVGSSARHIHADYMHFFLLAQDALEPQCNLQRTRHGAAMVWSSNNQQAFVNGCTVGCNTGRLAQWADFILVGVPSEAQIAESNVSYMSCWR
mmetsp:Transcript_91649/g.161609  ORF Transcript_91649/g.161609 Transcript_91649/m.161609 type:complete len:162 (+) Transcript_91649:2-487(+)